jgi:N6-L-threonylcarbamoyladenine synthase
LLGLPYPGGPHIDRAAQQGNATAFRFPRAVLDDGFNFSFSGLKTAVMRETQRYSKPPVADMAASFQHAVVDVLVEKTLAAAQQTGATAIHVGGGVAANSGLRSALDAATDLPVRYPPLLLCTDNAAMIGAAAYQHFVRKRFAPLSFDVVPSLQLS